MNQSTDNDIEIYNRIVNGILNDPRRALLLKKRSELFEVAPIRMVSTGDSVRIEYVFSDAQKSLLGAIEEQFKEIVDDYKRGTPFEKSVSLGK